VCGIVGIVDLAGRPVDQALVEAMNARQLHRGPDEDGVWFGDGAGLAMRRLSIIDVAGGTQPCYDESGDFVTVYNGEIYNYPMLRSGLLARGHVLKTHCDTEVIPHLYEERGADLVKELNAMFALALWDRRRRSLLLARDRLGIKPLHYATHQGRLYFASELKAFEPCGILGEPSPEAIYHYLTYGYIPAPRTIFKNVWKLPPAHHLTLNPGDIANADVEAFAIDTSTGNDCPRVGTLVVTPPNGFQSHLLTANLPICNATISSVD